MDSCDDITIPEKDSTESEMFLTENELVQCYNEELKQWICPHMDCKKPLSRKQTLKTHLQCIHGIQGGTPRKRYKRYQYDPDEPVPKSTKRFWSQKMNDSTSEYTELDLPGPSPASDSDNTTSTGMGMFSLQKDAIVCSAETCSEFEDIPNECTSSLQSQYDNTEIDSFDNSAVVADGVSNCVALTDASNYFCKEIVDTDACCDIQDMDISSDSDEESVSDNSESDSDADESEDSETVDDVHRKESPPLYVIPPSEFIQTAPLTHMQHVLSITAYATRHNLSAVAFKQLLDLVQLHLPSNNLCESSIEDVKKKCGMDDEDLIIHEYCEKCGSLYDSHDTEAKTCQTEDCGNKRYTNDGQKKNFFVTGGIDKQLKEVLEKRGNWEKVVAELKKPSSGIISDISSGEGYRQLCATGGFLIQSQNITLAVNTDGVLLFKSSGVHLWPVYLAVNELPPKERFLKKNLVVWGIYQGSSKPPMNAFFVPFVKDMFRLYKDGINICVNKKEFLCKAMLLIGSMDLPARADFLNMTHHNGEYGCLYCEEPGKVVKQGKGHVRMYPFTEEVATPRTNDSCKEQSKEASDTNKTVKGCHGKSIVACLPFFVPCDNIVIDYMHAVLLGISKKLLTLWTDGKTSREPYYIGDKVSNIDKRLKAIKPPYTICRRPRKIKNHLKHWKAAEHRSWLFFYSIPCLSRILPDIYLEHFACLVEGVYLLLMENITEDHLERAETLLLSFYEHSIELYSESIAGLNVHNLRHLVPCVRKWGPLWAYSCFGFESANGDIKRCVHGKRNVCKEIFWSIRAQKHLELEEKQVPKGEMKTYFRKLLSHGNRQLPPNVDAYKCCVVLPITDAKDLSPALKVSVAEFIPDPQAALAKTTKIVRNDFIFFSQTCKRVKKRNSYTALLDSPLYDGSNVVQISFFLIDKARMKVFAVCKTFATVGPAFPHRAFHVQCINERRNDVVVPAFKLKEPLVFIEVEGRRYVSRFPNFVEKD